jgi:hypothetical protein
LDDGLQRGEVLPVNLKIFDTSRGIREPLLVVALNGEPLLHAADSLLGFFEAIQQAIFLL